MKSVTIALRIPESQIEVIDALMNRINENLSGFSRRATRSDVLRDLLDRGIEHETQNACTFCSRHATATGNDPVTLAHVALCYECASVIQSDQNEAQLV